MKPGILSTEFWLALIVVLGGLFAANYADQQWAQIAGMVSSALASLGYGVARANVKKMEAAAVSVASGKVTR